MDSKTIQIGKTRYAYYEIANPGKPKMLLLHGMIVESHCLEKMASFLKDDYHLVFLDLKGHGKSGDGESYDQDYTNDAIAADLAAFHEAVVGEACHLVGYSLGGQYSIKFAAIHPDKVRRLVLIDSAPTLSLKGVFTILFAQFSTPKFFHNREHVRAYYDGRIPGLGRYMVDHCVVEDTEGRCNLRYDKKRFAPDTFGKSAARAKDLWEACRHIVAPTLLLRGDKSFVLNDKMERMMRQRFRQLEVVHLKNMEHNMIFTHPRELADHIRAFLAQP